MTVHANTARATDPTARTARTAEHGQLPVTAVTAACVIDTHCHLDARELAHDVDAVRRLARQRGVAQLVIPAVDVHNFGAVQALARRHGDGYALGIHPMCTPGAGARDLETLAQWLEQARGDPHLVAVGEIGLDFFVPGLDAAHQEQLFTAQLKLAQRFGLPVLLHVRRSADRVLKGVRAVPGLSGIAHAFNGSLQQAEAFIALGFKLGFGGGMTHERALQLRRLARDLPLASIVLETDTPDIPPHWLYRTAAERADGSPQGRNTPAELPRIAQALAELRGAALADLARQTTANALQVLPRLAALDSASAQAL